MSFGDRRPQRGGVPLSVVLPVLNEAINLPDALESITWADEIFVVDSGSTDGTRAIAEHAGAFVIDFSYRPGGPKKKAWALASLAFSHEWAFFLDADERVSPELRLELEEAIGSTEVSGFYVDRDMIFRGRPLRSYRPDWNLRLLRHARAAVEDLGLTDLPGTGDNEIHEHFLVRGRTGFLSSPLEHRDYRSIDRWIARHNKYATWEAHLYRKWKAEPLRLDPRMLGDPVARNRLLRRVWVRMPGRPLWRFSVWFFGKRAFRDGSNGLIYSALMGWYELVVSLKLAELERMPDEQNS